MHAIAESKIYHWVDKDGNSHFSDTPAADHEEVQIHEQNVFVNEKVANKTKSTQDPVDDQSEKIDYVATIVSPIDDQALRSNGGTINIQVSTEPEKENNHKLQLYLDGQALGKPQISPTIQAQNIDRGTHQLQVHLLDADGRLLTKTQIVTVHVQRVHLNKVQAVVR